MIKETNKIIDLLGGTGALAKLLNVNLSAVSNYRKKDFQIDYIIKLQLYAMKEILLSIVKFLANFQVLYQLLIPDLWRF